MTIPGLPEGVEVVRFGVAKEDEFEIIDSRLVTGFSGDHLIRKGPRTGSVSQIIVKPIDGWRFEPVEFGFVAVKMLPVPLTISATVRFKVQTDREKDAVNAALEALKQLPGFEELTGA